LAADSAGVVVTAVEVLADLAVGIRAGVGPAETGELGGIRNSGNRD
jgi:hypothetical protein